MSGSQALRKRLSLLMCCLCRHLLPLTKLDKSKEACLFSFIRQAAPGLLYSTHTTVEPDVLLPAAQLSS